LAAGGAQRDAGAVEEAGESPTEEVDGLTLALPPPRPVLLEGRQPAGAQRAVVEEATSGSRKYSWRRSLAEGAALAFFYSIPSPHPPGEQPQRAAGAVTP
jgi:hypothetical protein